MKIEMPLTLDVVTERPPFDYIAVKRGDNESRILVVSLTCMGKSFEIPEDASVELRCKKPDGTVAMITGNIIGNKIYIELNKNTLAVSGDAICELRIAKDARILTTVSFVMRILENALPDDYVISRDDFTSVREEFKRTIKALADAFLAEKKVIGKWCVATRIEDVSAAFILQPLYPVPYDGWRVYIDGNDISDLLAGNSFVTAPMIFEHENIYISFESGGEEVVRAALRTIYEKDGLKIGDMIIKE